MKKRRRGLQLYDRWARVGVFSVYSVPVVFVEELRGRDPADTRFCGRLKGLWPVEQGSIVYIRTAASGENDGDSVFDRACWRRPGVGCGARWIFDLPDHGICEKSVTLDDVSRRGDTGWAVCVQGRCQAAVRWGSPDARERGAGRLSAYLSSPCFLRHCSGGSRPKISPRVFKFQIVKPMRETKR